jgi:fibronectin-binding autotransporter adhesin
MARRADIYSFNEQRGNHMPRVSRSRLLVFRTLVIVTLLAQSIVLVPGVVAATHTVTSLANAGDGSLRAIVASAASGDSIQFDAGLSGMILLEYPPIVIDKNLTIIGPGAAVIEVNGGRLIGGGQPTRIFEVRSGASATISGLTVAGGLAEVGVGHGGESILPGEGGGILSVGTLLLSGMVISDNQAQGNGGGVFIAGSATITNSTISNNVAANTGGGVFVSNDTLATLTSVTISGNGAGVSGGGLMVRHGGAVLAASSVSFNHAHEYGGGIHNASSMPGYDLTITSSTVSNNSAGAGLYDPWLGWGGGIENDGLLYMTDSTISDNTAEMEGGGLHNYYGSASLTRTTVSGNTAAIGAGIQNRTDDGDPYEFTVLTLVDSSISDNTASDIGGGIASKNSHLEINGGTIAYNDAVEGGGIHLLPNKSSGIYDATISNNSATTGGGIATSDAVTISNVTVSGNSASAGAGIANMGAGTLTLSGSTFTNNSAGFSGGGLINQDYAVALITESSFVGNSAWAGGGGISNFGDPSDPIKPDMEITTSTLYDNDGGFGGGVYNSGTLELENSTVSGNRANGSGAGVENASGGSMSIAFSTIVDNITTFGSVAAGISSGEPLTIRSSIVSGNLNTFDGVSADCFGAGISSLGYNLSSDTTCPFAATGDLANNPNANLETLGDNGGSTLTHALLPGSAAINAMPAGSCSVAFDQRGTTRPQGGHCDIGSFEADGGPTFIVTNLDNAGTGSLRQVVQDAIAAPGTNTVTFQPGLTGTIQLTSGQITIAGDVEIRGPGESVIAVSGETNGRVFEVEPNVSAAISGLTITGGFADRGAGILNRGSLAVSRLAVSGNAATVSGGGIFNDGASLSVTDSLVSDNRAGTAAGGIWSGQQATISGSSIVGNSAGLIPGVVYDAGSVGGGIVSVGTLTIVDSEILSNTSNYQGGGVHNQLGNLTVTNSVISGNETLGGGTFVVVGGGGGLFNIFGTATLTDVIFEDNHAHDTGGALVNLIATVALSGSLLTLNSARTGGAIYSSGDLGNPGPNSLVTLTNTRVEGNSATRGDGGGVVNIDRSELRSSSSHFVGNHADWSGGGILSANESVLHIESSVLEGNSALASGGGISSDAGTLTIALSSITANTTDADGGGIHNAGPLDITDSSITGNEAGFSGGGVFHAAGTLRIERSTIDGNRAVAGDGGGVMNYATLVMITSTISGNSAQAQHGGGIGVDSGDATILFATITGNSAALTGGGIYATASSGALDVTASILANNAPGDNCAATVTSGGYNLSDDASCALTASGDRQNNASIILGVLADNGGPTRTHALLTGSSAINAIPNGMVGCGTLVTSDQRGEPRPDITDCDIGAVEMSGVTPPLSFVVTNLNNDGEGSLRMAVFNANTQPGKDTITFLAGLTGTIVLTSGQLTITEDVDIQGPGATVISVSGNNAGRVFASDSGTTVTISGLTMLNGSSSLGGAINNAGTMTLTDIVVRLSTSSLNGAGVYNGPSGTLMVVTSEISGNTASLAGGGIMNDGTLSLLSSTVSGNTSADGGGIMNNGSMTIADSTISGNVARRGGGTVNWSGRTLTIIDSVISGNFATVAAGVGAHIGGGLYDNGGTVTITGGEVSENQASISGGGIAGIGIITVTGTLVRANTAPNGAGFSTSGTLSVNSATIRNNVASEWGGGFQARGTVAIADSLVAENQSTWGAGISNQMATINVQRTTFSGNSALSVGGAIESLDGDVVIESSTFSGNSAGALGGAIYVVTFNQPSTMTIRNSTISGNTSNGAGGGIAVEVPGSQVWLIASTITNNSALTVGGGLFNPSGARQASITLSTTLVAANNATDAGPDAHGVLTDDGYNLIGNPSGSTGIVSGTNGNITGSAGAALDPRLGPLADNGGATQTHALLSGSPAINQIPLNSAGCGTTITNDQRGETRPHAGVAYCDIGAFESDDPALPGLSFVVINLNDAGFGSLRQAVINANDTPGPNTITFQQGLTGTIALTSGQLTIDEDVDIQGPGASVISVSGNGASRVFETSPGTTVTISGLTLTNGRTFAGDDADGAGVVNRGTLTLNAVIVSHNVAARDGGGIRNEGTLYLNDSTVRDNTADRSGGGLLNSFDASVATLTNVIVESNTASDGGGGIRNDLGTLSVRGGQILTNYAGGVSAFSGGGGMHTTGTATLEDVIISSNVSGLGGGGILSRSATTTILRSTIHNNDATTGGGGIWSVTSTTGVTESVISSNRAGNDGGGIYNIATTGSFDLVDSTVRENTASNGGGIYSRGLLSVSGSTISDNSAAQGGGILNWADATMTLRDSVVDGNRARLGGGILSRAGSALSIIASSVNDNAATNTVPGVFSPSGGGILALESDLSISNSEVRGNTSSGPAGGTGIFGTTPSGKITISGTTIADNEAQGAGGGILVQSGSNVEIRESTVSGNTGRVNGGGILNYGATVTVVDSLIEANTSLETPGIAGANGAGITVAIGAHLELSGTTIRNNTAPYGAGLIVFDTSTATVTGSTLSGNTSTTGDFFGGGGAIYNEGSLSIHDTAIIGNSAVSRGGGIFNVTIAGRIGNLTITSTVVDDNTARFGGGIHNDATLTFTDGSLSGNSAATGGGLFNTERGTLTLSSSVVSNNAAIGSWGGGVFNAGGVATIRSSTIRNNEAVATGGGVDYRDSLNRGSLLIVDSAVIGNVAQSGAGVWADTSMAITNSTISGNRASNWGGGIRARDSGTIVTVTFSTITDNTATNGGNGISTEFNGTVNLSASIVAGNATGDNCEGPIVSGGYNLSDDASCGLSQPSDMPSSTPVNLGPLADNGGETLTHAPLSGSLAINRIPVGVVDCGTVITSDQRGEARPFPAGGRCDIGAVELGVVLPLITPALTPATPDGLNGWYTSDVVVAWQIEDYGEPITHTDCNPSSVTTDTSGTTLTCFAENANGRSLGLVSLRRDATPPIISPNMPDPDPNTGWYNQATGVPTVTFNCSDVTSGIASCAAPHTFGQGANQAHSGTAVDQAGNTSSATVSAVSVDLTAPVIQTPGNLTLAADQGRSRVVDYSVIATDNLDPSPVVTCNPPSGSLFGIGTTTVTCTARDVAGNTRNASFTVTITEPVTWGGIAAPFSETGTVRIKRNSTVSVNIQLLGSGAGNVRPTLWIAPIVNGVVMAERPALGGVLNSGNEFLSMGAIFPSQTGRYVFNWNTMGLATGVYQARIDLGNGQSRYVRVQIVP